MADKDWAFADSHVWEANANTGSRRCATLELKNISDKWLERMLEFDVLRQRVFVSLKKILCHQFLRSFKVYLGTENWNEEKSRSMEGSEDWFTRAMQMQTLKQTQIEMQASSHGQRKRKEREIRKRSRSIFPRWSTMIDLLPIHVWEANTNASSRKWKFVCSLRWRLRLHVHLRWGGSHEQFLAFAFAFAFAFAEVLLVSLIDRGRCGY